MVGAGRVMIESNLSNFRRFWVVFGPNFKNQSSRTRRVQNYINKPVFPLPHFKLLHPVLCSAYHLGRVGFTRLVLAENIFSKAGTEVVWGGWGWGGGSPRRKKTEGF